MDTSFDETFALADDRAEALKQLIPGSDEYYYYHCLWHEQNKRPDEAAKLLEPWVKRLGWTSRAQEIKRRRALLDLKKDPSGGFETIRRELGLSFHHERELEDAGSDLPTRLDPAETSLEAWTQAAWSYGGSTDLQGFGDAALERLAVGKLEPDRRRALLQRLRRPDVPGLADLVLADLKHKHGSGFGSLPIHGLLTRAQLEELAKKDPALLKVENFVHALLLRRRPGPEEDWTRDPELKEAYLDALWEDVRDLVPAFNALKAHVLYHRLDFDRSRGVYDRARFDEYVKIPRQVGYAAPKYVESWANDPAKRAGVVQLGRDYSAVTALPAVSSDEALVVDYLGRFFAEAKDVKPYDTWILESWLKIVLAETKILGGAGDPEKWASLLNDPARYQALKDRVEVAFPPTNRTFYRAGDKVSIEVDVKNVRSLVVKVFEVNALNVFLARGEDVDTSLDLDGLVAAEERAEAFQEAPTRRTRRTFDFPSLGKPGVYVVEFIGGGISSRALVRKGRLRFVERTGAAGHVFTVLDEDFTPLREASIWMGGREYAADAQGEIAIPFSERPGRQPILLRHGGLTTLEVFEHRAESYDFTAGIYVDREALLRGAEARVLLRPSLRVHGAAVSLKLLEEPVLAIRSTDRFGVESSREIRGLELRDDRETAVDLKVPDELASLSFELRGRVETLAGRKADVADARAFSLNGIEASEKTQDLHLARTEKGYVLYALGKTGEPRSGVPVSVTLAHREFSFTREWSLRTDARGRAELGALEGVARIDASLSDGTSQSWTPPRDQALRTSALHARAGEALRVPWSGEAPKRESLALLERVNGTYRADWFDALGAKDGFLTAGPLGAGDYELVLKDEGRSIELRVSDGVRAAGWLAADTRLLEESPSAPIQISKIKASKDELRVRVENATPSTRVHVFATRYLPAHSAFHELGREGLREPGAVGLGASPSAYVSGRDIGDEVRYILDRKRSARWPGNMLARPGLILNPWATRTTSTDVAAAAEGEAYGSAGAPAPCAAKPRHASAPPPPPPGAVFSSLDFLAKPSAALLNLAPGTDGTVAIPRQALAHANQVRIVAVDESGAVSRDVFLPECGAAPRDLRLLLGLDPAKHYGEKKDVAVVDAGGSLEIADVTTTKLEIYDTLGRAFTLLRTLSGLAELDAFEFVTRWTSLSDAEKRSKYGEFACHELHFFLSKKDPAFFKAVILPYLRNKKDKTFMDRWLLNDDLSAYRRPWDFGRLNVVERILLGRRIAEERGPLKRHASELCDLLSRDLNAENARFDTALKGKALETGDALGMGAASRSAAKQMMMASRAAMPASMAAPEELAMDVAGGDDEERKEEAPAKSSKKKDAGPGRSRQRDLDRRRSQRALYRTLDQTQEWAENNYWKRPIAEQGPELVTINRFWRDYAAHDDASPFLSPRLPEASRSLTEVLFALAVLDLPFEAKAPSTSFDGARMKLSPKGLTAVFHRQIRPSEPSPEKVPVLVSQNFLRDDDRERYEGDESFDKYVSDEFLVHTVYVGQVVLTNPTSSTHKLDLLLQIPVGALPAKNGFYTRGIHVELAPYATETHEYAFYFPAPGTYAHYPVHVSRNEKLVASAVPWPLKVVGRLTNVDTTSWEHVSQHADAKTALKFLKENNVERLDLERAAWRMKDKAFYAAALDLLASRHVYHDTLWSYALHHEDVARARDYLAHQEEWLKGAGLRLEAPALEVDPVERRWYEHLEYAPLVNARAGRLGASRRILNDRFSEQYQRLMATLRYRAALDADDRLAVTYYLFLQDRVEEALAAFERVKREEVETKLQYDYLKVYAELYRERLKAARGVAEKYRDYPVDRWRKLFQNALAQLDEAEGAAATSDAEDKQGKLAADAPAFDLDVERRQVSISHRNLASARVNYYKMDLELLFSRQPFVQERSDRFGFIMPNRSDVVTLPKKEGTQAFPLPEEFHGANVVVEVVADGRRVSKPCFAHELDVALVETYGQLRVSRRGTKAPLSKVYVKCYARTKDGETRFYKDGYTDPRGRFDYASLSTDDLERVERFALLVMSDELGAVVREAEAPKR